MPRRRPSERHKTQAGNARAVVREYIGTHTEITDVDRLDFWSFDEDAYDDNSPPSDVLRDPSLLLAWCRRYQPDLVLGDKAAQVKARGRVKRELVRRFRQRDPKASGSWEALAKFIEEEGKGA